MRLLSPPNNFPTPNRISTLRYPGPSARIANMHVLIKFALHKVELNGEMQPRASRARYPLPYSRRRRRYLRPNYPGDVR